MRIEVGSLTLFSVNTPQYKRTFISYAAAAAGRQRCLSACPSVLPCCRCCPSLHPSSPPFLCCCCSFCCFAMGGCGPFLKIVICCSSSFPCCPAACLLLLCSITLYPSSAAEFNYAHYYYCKRQRGLSSFFLPYILYCALPTNFICLFV